MAGIYRDYITREINGWLERNISDENKLYLVSKLASAMYNANSIDRGNDVHELCKLFQFEGEWLTEEGRFNKNSAIALLKKIVNSL